MKNQSSLYFDMWRKTNYKGLLQAYIYTATTYPTKTEMILGFGYALDKFVDGGRGAYEGTKKQWNSVYILGRELGIFYEENGDGGYEISPLAREVLHSHITLEKYLFIYFMNLSQLINGKIVHVLKEILLCFGDNNGTITKENVLDIPEFNLKAKSESNRNQIVNILLQRLVEAEIIERKEIQYSLNKYKFSELFNNINIYKGSVKEFEEMDHKEFVDLLTTKKSSSSITNEYREGLFEFIE